MPPTLAFRGHEAADGTVCRAHADHPRWAMAGWPIGMVARFRDQQHEVQERHLTLYRTGAERRMILIDGLVVGRLCLDRTVLP